MIRIALLWLLASVAFAQPATTVTTSSNQTITGVKTFSGSNKLCLKDPGDADIACIVAQAISGAQTFTLPAVTGTLATLADLAASGGGDVFGPASSTNNGLVLFDGTTGKLVKDAGGGLGTGVLTFLGTPSSANLRSALTDETGTGGAVFATSPTIDAPTVSGHATIEGVTATGATGTGKFVFDGTPTLITPVLGVASATSINKVAITAPATSATLTIADGKTLTVSNSITLAGTDSRTYTFPSTNATIARTDAANTFTGTQTFSSAPIHSSLTAGRIPYNGASKEMLDSANLSWDNANATLSVGTPHGSSTNGISVDKTVAGLYFNVFKNSSNNATAGVGVLAQNDGGASFALYKASTTAAVPAAGTLYNDTGRTVIATATANPIVMSPNLTDTVSFSSTGVTFADAITLTLGTTTGTKIGTATSQKIGLWNATPIVQPTTAVAAATFVANTSGIANDTATFDGYTIGQIVKALRNIGALQ